MNYGYTIVNGIVSKYPCLRMGDLKQNLLEAVEVGTDSVEIHLADPELVDVKEVKEILGNKVTVSAIGTGLSCGKYGLALTSGDDETLQKTYKFLRAYIDLAAELDAGIIIGSIRGKNEKNLPINEYETAFIEAMKPVIEYAREKNTLVFLETINHYELPFYNSLETMGALIRKIDSEFVKIHIDTFHMNIEDTTVYECVKEIKDIIGHVHIADNTRLEPGTGTFDFKSFKRALEEIGYTGAISMECFNPNDERRAIVEGLNYLRQA